MAINQTILAPLTTHSGSLSAHTVPAGATQGQLMTIISSSLPLYQAPFWNYKIKTETTYVTSSVLQNINELRVNFTDTLSYYLVIGYYGVGCSSVNTGIRVGNTFASFADGNISTEVPESLFNYIVGYDTTPSSSKSPSNDVNNFYLARVLIIGKSTSATANYIPSLAVSATGSGITASMGPSVVFWTKLTTV